jgi:hypothetical protein
VPARRLATSQTTARLKCDSVVLPSTTSSVITDICEVNDKCEDADDDQLGVHESMVQ